MEILYKGFFKSMSLLPYQRFLSVFFPPNDKDNHLKLYQFFIKNPNIDSMMDRAFSISKRMGPNYEVSAKDCKSSLLSRLDLLMAAQDQNCGLVDVIKIV
jgi:hypothetical protein